jgi:hypothetical protein
MKKNIRKIGMLMIIFSLMACTKEVDILEPNLIGLYKYRAASISVPVDLDKDGVGSGDLTLEKGKECIWDNTWQFQKDKVTLREGETFCGDISQEADENGVIGSFDYVYDKDNHTIKITYENGLTEILKNVKLGYAPNYEQTLSFELWNGDIQQVVTYYLETE